LGVTLAAKRFRKEALHLSQLLRSTALPIGGAGKVQFSQRESPVTQFGPRVRAGCTADDLCHFPEKEGVTFVEAALKEAVQSLPMAGLFEQFDGIGDPSLIEEGSSELDEMGRITPVTVQEVSLFQAPQQSLSRHRVFLARLILTVSRW
jgi:hypothetical protein